MAEEKGTAQVVPAKRGGKARRQTFYDHLLKVRPDGYLLRRRRRYERRLKRLERVAQDVGTSAAAQSARRVYSVANLTVDRTYDADTVAVAELADVVGTLIKDLQDAGVLTG